MNRSSFLVAGTLLVAAGVTAVIWRASRPEEPAPAVATVDAPKSPPEPKPEMPDPIALTASSDAQGSSGARRTERIPAASPTSPVGSAQAGADSEPEPDIDALRAVAPTLGGTEAIERRYRAADHDARAIRLAEIEQYFSLHAGESLPDDEAELYQALKDELEWLRANPGTKPK